LVIALVLIMAGVAAAMHFVSRDATLFCEPIRAGDSTDAVRQKAKSQGYAVHERERSDGSFALAVPTKDAPFFRMACIVIYDNDVMRSKEVIAYD